MKNPPTQFRHAILLASLALLPLLTEAQTKHESATAQTSEMRPTQSDSTSQKLIKNYLTITGGQQAHRKLLNVVAEGTIKESTLTRNFRLVETNDGKRHLTYYWTHLGRPHRELHVFDGVEVWTQSLEPQKHEAQHDKSSDGAYFANHRWLIQPFNLPLLADYVFKYQGSSKSGGRTSYVVKGFGKKDRPSWFYFDKDKSLLTRWGGAGKIAGTTEQMDYRATRFKSVDGLIFPTHIDLLAENAVYGHIEFTEIAINQDLNDFSFFFPKSSIPTLRQRSVLSK